LADAGDIEAADAFLQNLSERTQWSVEVSKSGGTALDATHEDLQKHDAYIFFTGHHEEERGVLNSITEQVGKLYERVSCNFRARFIFVVEIPVNVPLQQLATKIFGELWKYFSIMNVLLIIPAKYLETNDAIESRVVSRESASETELLLYSWFPYTSQTHCDKVHSPVLTDRWTSKGEFALKANLFPDKVPKTFQGCKSNVYAFLYPPAVMEKSSGEYTGLEINYIEILFQKLNLTPVYNILPYKYKSHFDQFHYTIRHLEPSSSDIAIGIMPFGESGTSTAESTISYADVKIKWYVPCPKQVSRMTSISATFSTQVWLCLYFFATVAVVTMWLMAKYVTKHHERESSNYMTIIHCIYNLWALMTGVSVPEKPISNALRILFLAWAWFSVSVSTVYQAFFVGFLVNPRFERSIATLSELIESKIECGMAGALIPGRFSDPMYDTVTKNLKICTSRFKCLERVLRHDDFATISDTFHAEYFKLRLLFLNTHVPLCTLREDLTQYMISTYMAKGNPLLKTFNKMIRYFLEAGLFEKWYSDFMSDIRLGGQPIEGDDANLEGIDDKYLNNGYSPYSMCHLQVVFYSLLFGHAFSVLVLLGELLYYRTWAIKASATAGY
jgi:hypothetical protein